MDAPFRFLWPKNNKIKQFAGFECLRPLSLYLIYGTDLSSYFQPFLFHRKKKKASKKNSRSSSIFSSFLPFLVPVRVLEPV
jgi:hypothetical protein